MSSASRKTTTALVAARTPELRAAAAPRLVSCWISRTRGPPARTASAAVPSVEQSSTTTTSFGGSVCCNNDPSPRPIPIMSRRGLDEGGAIEGGLQVVAEGFLSKPIHHVELRARVKKLLR